MSISVAASAIGALAALVFAGLLARRFIRAPTMAMVALLFAVLGLIVALAAQADGYARGFDQTTFRAIQLGAQLVAPLALAWALAELTGKSMGARFASRLALGAITVVGAVVLATDPLNTASFSKSWPAGSVHYQLIPTGLLKFVAVVTAIFALVAVIVTAVRARQRAGWRTLLLAVVAIAVAILLTDLLRMHLPANSAYVLICVAAAGLAWFAGARASVVRLESLRSGGYAWDEDTGSFVRYHDEDAGDFGYADDTGGFDRFRGETDGGDWHGDDTGGFRRDVADTDLRGWFRPGGEQADARRDEGVRRDTSLEKLAALPPAFSEHGTVTAGSSSQISDGAAAVLIMSEERASSLGLVPRGRFHTFAVAANDPQIMLTAPIPATELVLSKAKLSLDDIDLVEINEAFASVVLAWERELHPDPERVNPNGGAIAIGHPVGATGARLVTTALHELERADGHFGLVTMCCGGGLGTGTILERLT